MMQFSGTALGRGDVPSATCCDGDGCCVTCYRRARPSPVTGNRVRIPLQGEEAPGKPGMLAVRCPFMEFPERQILLPSFILHPLPHLRGHRVESDVESRKRGGLVERLCGDEIVPSGVECEPKCSVLHLLETTDGPSAEGVGGDW